MKKNILVIGSSNTDMTIKTERLPKPGETVLGGVFNMGAGGKGANQAVAASRLGGNVSFVCKVGNDVFGSNAVRNYKAEGLDTSNILYSEYPSGVALIYVDKNAENCIVVASGANSDLTASDIESISSKIVSSDILLMQLEIPVEAVMQAARISSEAGKYVVLNPAPAAELPADIYKYVSLIVPNQTELNLMTGITCTSVEAAKEGAAILQGRGVKNVIVTMGAKGALVCDSAGSQFVEARKVQAVDTTAAGDTFCGAVCVALAEGMSLLDSVRFATVASSLTVQKIGAQDSIPFIKDVQNIIY